jgi:hypothetical protein
MRRKEKEIQDHNIKVHVEEEHCVLKQINEEIREYNTAIKALKVNFSLLRKKKNLS